MDGFSFSKRDVFFTYTEAPQASASEQVVQTVEVQEDITTVVREEVTTAVNEEPEESSNGVGREPYIFDEAKLQQLNKILSRYNGTHNFHNFTARTKPEDPSAKRYIISFEAGEAIEVQGVQFVPCTVIGQSFMLHQIRKMIGTAIAIMRGCVPETIIDFALRRCVLFFHILMSYRKCLNEECSLTFLETVASGIVFTIPVSWMQRQRRQHTDGSGAWFVPS